MRAVASAGMSLLAGAAFCWSAVGCGGGDDTVVVRRTSVIDEMRGTYRGVGLGGPREAMFAAFGVTKPASPENAAAMPLEGETRGAWTLDYPKPYCGMPIYRYQRAAFGFTCGKLLWIVTTEPGAQTARGVAVGDPLRNVAAAYPEAVCGTAGDQYAACSAKLAKGRFIWFGGNPVATIELASVPLEGVRQEMPFAGRVFTLEAGEFVTYPPGKVKPGDKIVCEIEGKRIETVVPRPHTGVSKDPMRVVAKPDGSVRAECGGIHAETAPEGSG